VFSIILTLFFITMLSPGLKILCMNFVRTVGNVQFVIIPIQTATVLQADTSENRQTLSDNFRHPLVL
jgi:hypothetical protein